MSKNNNVRIVTPIGISQYAWLTTPDTQFDQDGHYKTNLIVNAKESQSVVKAIDDEIKKNYRNNYRINKNIFINT